MRYETECSCKDADPKRFEKDVGDYVVGVCQVAHQLADMMQICLKQRPYLFLCLIATLTRQMNAVLKEDGMPDEEEWAKIVSTLQQDVHDRVDALMGMEQALVQQQEGRKLQ